MILLTSQSTPINFKTHLFALFLTHRMIHSIAPFGLKSKKRCRKLLTILVILFQKKKTRTCPTHGQHGKKFPRCVQQMIKQTKKIFCNYRITATTKSHFQFPEPTCTGSKMEHPMKISMKEKMMKALLGLFCFVFKRRAICSCQNWQFKTVVLSALVCYVLFPPKLHNDFTRVFISLHHDIIACRIQFTGTMQIYCLSCSESRYDKSYF